MAVFGGVSVAVSIPGAAAQLATGSLVRAYAVKVVRQLLVLPLQLLHQHQGMLHVLECNKVELVTRAEQWTGIHDDRQYLGYFFAGCFCPACFGSGFIVPIAHLKETDGRVCPTMLRTHGCRC